MKKYNILVYLNDGTNISIHTEYDRPYELQTVISSYGKNGIWDIDKNIYYPAHRIDKIECIQKIDK